jgi:hypothetical protein
MGCNRANFNFIDLLLYWWAGKKSELFLILFIFCGHPNFTLQSKIKITGIILAAYKQEKHSIHNYGIYFNWIIFRCTSIKRNTLRIIYAPSSRFFASWFDNNKIYIYIHCSTSTIVCLCQFPDNITVYSS